MKSIGFVFLMFIFSGAHAADLPEVHWGFTDTTTLPAQTKKFLFSEDQKLYQRLVKALPEYTHSFFNANMIRIEHELKKGPLTCYPSSSNTETRKDFTYLTPLYISPSPVLVMKKELAEKLKNKSGEVSLQKLLQTKALKPLLIEARSYGPAIDKVLREHGGDALREIMPPFYQNVVDIISHGRGDYAIEYRLIVEEYIATNKRYKDVITVPIEEVPAFLTQYLACSKTPEGLKVIEKIDKLLQAQSKEASYKSEILAFNFDPEGKAFNEALSSFLRLRQKSHIIHH